MVTIPTIDQISGTTVMNKMRSLINNYISFADEISDEFTDLTEFVNTMYVNIQAVIGTVNQAVETANAASASAQESATIVSGYNDRLTTVENKYVTKDTPQDITGFKTIKNSINWETTNTQVNTKVVDFDSTAPSEIDLWRNTFFVKDKNNLAVGLMGWLRYTNGLDIGMLRNQRYINGSLINKQIDVRIDANGNGWAEAPTRTYASGNINDIVTVASLASNPNVVHTVNSESISGQKTLLNNLIVRADLYVYTEIPSIFVRTTLNRNDITSSTAMGFVQFRDNQNSLLGAVSNRRYSNESRTILSVTNKNGDECALSVTFNDSGTATLVLSKTISGTPTTQVVATL